MILRAEELKDVCSKILPAVDSDGTVTTETLQVKALNKEFSISVTNKEYFVTVRLNIEEDEAFNATVNASLFLKLVSQITTDTITLTTKDNALIVKGNGTYKLPMIFENDSLLELKPIVINNETVSMSISGEILNSILQVNAKNVAKLKDRVSRPIEKYFYVDEKGAITSLGYGCVNNFNLDKPVKMLLSQKVVKLFKLFKGGEVQFVLGHDALSDDIVQTKVRFDNGNVTITAILSCDDYLINSFPAMPIRNCAEQVHQYSAVFNKDELLQAINRFMLFVDNNSRSDAKSCAKLTFDSDSMTIEKYDYNEVVLYDGMLNSVNDKYSATLDLVDLKSCLESSNDQHITLNFGDKQSFVMGYGNVKNVIPEWDED